MNTHEISDRQNTLWLMASMTAPLAKAASGGTWLSVLTLGSVTLLITWGLGKFYTRQRPWLDLLQGLWASVAASELLYWCEGVWPGHSYGKATALILLALCVWSAYRDRSRTARGGCVLIWPLGGLLGLLLLSAAPEVKVQNLAPVWQMPDAAVITVLLFPALYARQKTKPNAKAYIGLLCFALIVSVITAGVLSPRVSGGADSAIYELSRSVSPFGMSRRLESAAAAGLTIGYFLGIGYLLSVPETVANRSRMVLTYGALAGLMYGMNIRLDSRFLAIGSITLWVILPALCGAKNFFQKPPKDP